MTTEQPRVILRPKEVCKNEGFSRTTLWRKVRAGTFPAPVQIGSNMIGFYADEIAARQAALPRVVYAEAEAA